jgi:hypothetical protein
MIRVNAPAGSLDSTAGTVVPRAVPIDFFATTTAAYDATNGYAWSELRGVRGSGFAAPSLPLTGNHAYEVTGRTDVPVGSVVRLFVDRDQTTYGLVLIRESTPASAAACSWLANVASGVCVKVTVASAGGSCSSVNTSQKVYLTYSGGAWTGTTNFNYGSGSGPLTFSINSGVPSLSLGGTAGVYLRCKDGKATFAFGNSLCYGSGSGFVASCDGGLILAVECSCCPIAGWHGEGWYCCRDAGSLGPCVAVHLLDSDACDTSIQICSGPYTDETAALAACGTVPVGGCPAIPKTVYAHLFGISGAACDAGPIALAWDGSVSWAGSGTVNGNALGITVRYTGSSWVADISGCATHASWPLVVDCLRTDYGPSGGNWYRLDDAWFGCCPPDGLANFVVSFGP